MESSNGLKPAGLGLVELLEMRASREVEGMLEVEMADIGRFWPAATLLSERLSVGGALLGFVVTEEEAEASRCWRRALALRRLISWR